MRASWRRRTRRLFAAVFGGYLAVVLVPSHLYAVAAGTGHATYLAGALAGVGLTLSIALRDTPPPHIAHWELGAYAEKWTAAQLRPLRRRGWRILHDRRLDPTRPENLDHLLVGPAGVYVLDSKRWPGTITVDPATGKVTVASHDAPDLTSTRDIAGAVRALGWRVHQHLAATTPRPTPWVQAVVVFWGDFPQRHVHTGRVHYVAGDHLRTWLLEQPTTGRLDLDVVTAALRDGLPTA